MSVLRVGACFSGQFGVADPTLWRQDTSCTGDRIFLNEEAAFGIYKYKTELTKAHQSYGEHNLKTSYQPLRGKALIFASHFNVSPKTIRDIWARRTWQKATNELWREESNDFYPFTRSLDRKTKKDSKTVSDLRKAGTKFN